MSVRILRITFDIFCRVCDKGLKQQQQLKNIDRFVVKKKNFFPRPTKNMRKRKFDYFSLNITFNELQMSTYKSLNSVHTNQCFSTRGFDCVV